MIICPLDELGGDPRRDGAGTDEDPADLSRWGAQLLLVQHPELAWVRFSCRCVGCHHQILTARFGAALAEAWLAVRGDLIDPAEAGC